MGRLLLLGLLLMARTPTTAQAAALAALDRQSHLYVEVEGPDGHFVDITDFLDEDWLDAVTIDASVEEPVGAATVRLRRDVADFDGSLLSLAPLMEGSRANVDSLGAYAPAVDASRRINVYVDVTEPGGTPDWQWLFEGRIDDPEWGGRASRMVLEARDPMGRLNDTIIETIAYYGGGSPLAAIEDVMQAILNDNFGSGEFPLTVIGDPDFGVADPNGNPYPLGNVSVLEALVALRDLQGWNLHWRWLDSPAEFGLTYYEPTRDAALLSGYVPDHTLGPDDYFDVSELKLITAGIRNAGEVIYTDSSGADQTVSEERSSSIALYGRRFIRLDERGGQITTQAQAEALLTAILDDLEGAALAQTVECAFLWNVELGDTVRFSANGVHYDTDQDLAVIGYRHELSGDRRRTTLRVAGKPSGGYARWHRLASRPSPPDVTGIEVDFDANGLAVISVAATPNARTIYVTVGDGAEPDVPTAAVNDGSITGRSGTVATSVKIATGNVAYVSAVAVGENARPGPVKSVQFARRIGQFWKDTDGTTVTGTTSETTLGTASVPGGVLGIDGSLEAVFALLATGTNGTKTLRVYFGSTLLGTLTLASSFSAAARLEVLLTNDGADDSQIASIVLHRNGADPTVLLSTALEDSSGDLNLYVSAQLANGSDSVSLQLGRAILAGTE